MEGRLGDEGLGGSEVAMGGWFGLKDVWSSRAMLGRERALGGEWNQEL